MRVIFIRHGRTAGNEQQRYVGRTDEELSCAGAEEIRKNSAEGIYPPADIVWTSPMKRCLQTAELIYPKIRARRDEELRECDFGLFEYRNHVEMADDPYYQAWIDSGGKLPFPGGEDGEKFRRRSCGAFLRITEECGEEETTAFVVHGGTIMSVLERFEEPSFGFYGRQVKNGCGFVCEFDRREKKLKVLRKIGSDTENAGEKKEEKYD